MADLSSSDLLTEAAIPVLERHLEQQCREGSLDARSNRALVRLYALFPARANGERTALALAKALTLHPEPEFLQLLYLVPEGAYTPAVRGLIEVDQALSGADWSRFWPRVEQADVAPIVAKVAGFADAVRDYAFSAVNHTYSRIEVASLAAVLHLPEAQATAFAVGKGATESSAAGSAGPAGAAASPAAAVAAAAAGAAAAAAPTGPMLVLPVMPDNSDRKRTDKLAEPVLRPAEVASILGLLTR